MDKESLSYKTLKNSTYTFINYAVPILFSIFITPVIVHRLGVSDFGVFVLVNTIVGFLGLLDIGLTTALMKLVSEYYAQQDFPRLQKLLNSANTLFFLIGIFSLLAFIVAGLFFLPVFNISQESSPHILIVFILGGLYLFINAANSVFTILPGALQRFDVSTKVSLTQLTFFNLATLVAVLLGYKLKVIWALNVFSISVSSLYLVWFFKRMLPQIRLGFAWDITEIRKAYSFGILAAVANIANSFLTQLDRLIIPMFLNTAELSFYSLPGNVAQKTSGVLGSITGVFFPLISSLSGVGETEKIRIIYRRTLRLTVILAAAFTAAISLFAREILGVWLGPEFADRGWQILIILAFTYFFLSVFGSASNFLMGLNKVKFLAAVSVVLAAVNLILLFGLLPTLGIVGAAWAYLGAAVLVPAILYITEKRFLQLSGFGSFYVKLSVKLIIVSAVFYLIIAYLVRPLADTFINLVIIGPLSVIFYLVLYRVFGFFDREDVELFSNYFNQIKNRLFLKKA